MNHNHSTPNANPEPQTERGSILKPLLLVLALLAVSASLTYAMIVIKPSATTATPPASKDDESDHKIVFSQNPIFLGEPVTITITKALKEKPTDLSIYVDGHKVIDGRSGVYTATNAGTFTVTAKDDSNSIPYTTNLTVVSVTLSGVTFSGGNHPVCNDADGNAYPTTQWTTSTNYPVCYTRDTKMTVQPQFTVVPSTFAGPVRVKGISSGPKLPETNTLANPTLESKTKFEKKVDFLNPLTIDWQCSLDKGKTWHDIATSANKVYVTLKDPTCATLYHTVVHLACSKPGATKPDEAVANTWSLFSTGTGPANVTTWDGRPLYYYRTNTAFSDNVESTGSLADVGALLASSNGSARCGVWTEFLMATFAANGVSSTKKTIEASDAGYTAIFTKKWIENSTFPGAFNSPYHSTPWEMQPELNKNYGPLTDTDGNPGQNSPTPSEKIFSNHAFVKYDKKYYDPSYGFTYSGSADFQNQALECVATGGGFLLPDGSWFYAPYQVSRPSGVWFSF